MDLQTDQNPKQQLVERLNTATNILVTVSTDPSVDQLAAAIGLTLWLNKLGKHATAVFSGEVPSTLEFLKPEETIEKNTDSLRDFIISLDKAKADKLRYKVEDRVVKIFITPYRTNLSVDDLEFSQGDFNVDAIIALGVAEQQDLDNAITAHGRILHDATVMSINTAASGGLGVINWHDTQASSLCELVVDVGNELGKDQLDGQIATALLTGIVAETDRFSNEKTLPQTMSISAELMSSGANQQLVASKLEGPSVDLHAGNTESQTTETTGTSPTNDDGTLEIGHKHEEPEAAEPAEQEASEESPVKLEPEDPQTEATNNESHLANADVASKLITEPPAMGGMLTANSSPERPEHEPGTDPFSNTGAGSPPLLDHQEAVLPTDEPPAEEPEQPEPEQEPAADTSLPHWNPPAFLASATPPEGDVASTAPTAAEPAEPAPEPAPTPEIPAPAVEEPPTPADETLSELEASVGAHQQSSEEKNGQTELAESARSDLQDVYSENPVTPMATPEDAMNVQPSDAKLPSSEEQPAPPSTTFDPAAFGAINDPDAKQPTPQPLQVGDTTVQPSAAPVEMPVDPDAPPPVPPPFNPVQPPADQKQ